jgi:hypothetical protein
LLVDAEQDRGRRRDDERPAPSPAQHAHAGDFGFLQIADTGVGIFEFDSLGCGRRIGQGS